MILSEAIYNPPVCQKSANAGKKFLGDDDELLLLALQHHGGFARSERRASLDEIRLALKRHRRARFEGFQPLMIRLWIDSFHAVFFIAHHR
jgi:hypothetical protein